MLKKKIKNEVNILDKQDLIKYMTRVGSRIENNAKEELKQESALGEFVRQTYNRENRVLDRFQNQIEQWEIKRNQV